jgi:hypothetical protein
MESCGGDLLAGENMNLAVARIALNALQSDFDPTERALKHLSKNATVEDQRPGDAEKRIVLSRGLKDFIHFHGHIGEGAVDLVPAVVDQAG